MRIGNTLTRSNKSRNSYRCYVTGVRLGASTGKLCIQLRFQSVYRFDSHDGTRDALVDKNTNAADQKGLTCGICHRRPLENRNLLGVASSLT